MLDIGLGHLDVLASTASDQGFKVKLVKSNGRENDVRKQKCRSRWQGLRGYLVHGEGCWLDRDR